ncbi:MAG: hypothetical protein K6U87_03245 [Firmicutes bacterium]|nr:hypothetical protein [Bacillota bacterium]
MDQPPGTLWVVSVGGHRWAAPVGVVVGLVDLRHGACGRDLRTGLTWAATVDARRRLGVAPRAPHRGVGLLWRGSRGHHLVIVDALEYLWTPPRAPEPDHVWRAETPPGWHAWVAAAYRLGPRWIWRWREDWIDSGTGRS